VYAVHYKQGIIAQPGRTGGEITVRKVLVHLCMQGCLQQDQQRCNYEAGILHLNKVIKNF
jgi:hypothetical protein